MIALLMTLAFVAEYFIGSGAGVLAASALVILPTDDEETKKAKTALIEAKNAAVTEAKDLLAKAIKADSEEFKSAIETILSKAFEGLTVKQDDKDVLIVDAFKSMQAQFDKLATDFNEQKHDKNVLGKETSLKTAFATIVPEITKDLSKFAGNSNPFRSVMSMKAVGDITFGNFGTGAYESITTQTLPGVERDLPLNDFWFRNILPNATTQSEIIRFLRYTGGEGGAAIWDERANPLVAKPEVDMDFVLETEEVIWIAATARTHRGMLMDAPFLNSFIPQELVYGELGILVAENAYIWDKLVDNSTVYDNGSSLTVPVERIYDAAFGQLKDYRRMPTHILLNHRDELEFIAFNKADGSGEYDLPNGTVTVVNGRLYINGVRVIGVPEVPRGKFMVLDNRVTTFFSRLSPDVQISGEDRDNFIKNLVTFRAEERIATIVKNVRGVIYGDLEAGS